MKYVHTRRTGVDNTIVIVELSRPVARNAFHTGMAEELLQAFQEIASSDARAVLLQSTNGKAFCAGADLKERNGMADAEWRDQHQLFEQMFYARRISERSGSV